MFETTNQKIIESSSNSGFEQSSTDPGDHKSPFCFPQPITPEKHLHLTREASPKRQQRAQRPWEWVVEQTNMRLSIPQLWPFISYNWL